jgi:CheY-like chemotaxis protein
MPSVLICAPTAMGGELRQTLLWRADVQRREARSAAEALAAATSTHPKLILVETRLPEAEQLVEALRTGAETRHISIVIMARGEFSPRELRFIEAGANPILRLPVGPEWDVRLGPLMSVPPRRRVRLAVQIQVAAESASTLAGTVVDLSEHGMLVETDVALPLGVDVEFKIHLRDAPAPLQGSGQVVRQPGHRQTGIKFYGLDAEAEERIRQFVAKEPSRP